MRLIVGGDSEIGAALAAAFRTSGTSYRSTSRHPEGPEILLDLSDPPGKWAWPSGVTATFLCAAVTSLEKCQEHPEATAFVNVDQSAALARGLVGGGSFVVFPSTNLVFDGARPFLTINDRPNPREEYGRQKLRAEQALLALGRNVAIVRLTKVVHPRMPLLRAWAKALQNGEAIHPFEDVCFSPISLDFVVEALLMIAERKLAGVTQVSGDRDISYADCAFALAEALGTGPRLVQPVRAPAGARRYSTMDMSRAKHDLSLDPPRVNDTLAAVFRQLK